MKMRNFMKLILFSLISFLFSPSIFAQQNNLIYREKTKWLAAQLKKENDFWIPSKKGATLGTRISKLQFNGCKLIVERSSPSNAGGINSLNNENLESNEKTLKSDSGRSGNVTQFDLKILDPTKIQTKATFNQKFVQLILQTLNDDREILSFNANMKNSPQSYASSTIFYVKMAEAGNIKKAFSELIKMCN